MEDKKNVEGKVINIVNFDCPPYDLNKMREDIFKMIREDGYKVPDFKEFKSITIPFKEIDRKYDNGNIGDAIFREANKYYFDTTNHTSVYEDWDGMGPFTHVNVNLLDPAHIIVVEMEFIGDVTIRSTRQHDIDEIQKIIDKYTTRIFPRAGNIYKHFKLGFCEVVSITINADNTDKFVIYRSDKYGYSRNYSDLLKTFMDKMDKEKHPDYEPQEYNFEFIAEKNDGIQEYNNVHKHEFKYELVEDASTKLEE